MTRQESNRYLNIEKDAVMSELNIKTSLLMIKLKEQRRYNKFVF